MTQTTSLKLPASFHREMAALVRELEDLGWTGRLSTPGHAIMRAPDGKSTCSITPKLGSPRHLVNNRTKIERWKREHGVSSAPANPESVDTSPTCPDCGKPFQTVGRVNIHAAHAHRRVLCPFGGCGRETSPAQQAVHLATHYGTSRSKATVARELDNALATIERLSSEVAEWQALAEEAEARFVALQQQVRATS
ncbi:hypothetical protein [Longimicrobium sp.]|jgi:hypothetical protein|uniref:hypothetical protein n=1 Tax=Longimicrobium sp. TaxID=2029185 RepID=UPI002EDB6DDC